MNTVIPACLQAAPGHRLDRHMSIHDLIINRFPGVSVDTSRGVPACRRDNGRAAVADDGIVAVMPALADHFGRAYLRHFGYDDIQGAIEWMKKN